jgi:DNA-binding XRE family transcriptional regulator
MSNRPTHRYAFNEYSINEYAINEYRRQEEILGIHKAKVDLPAIGSRIRKLRGQILQEELCKYLHVTQGHLSKIERGKIAPSLEMLILLSDRFHKSVDWMLRGEGNYPLTKPLRDE